jgi:hypothetical protein
MFGCRFDWLSLRRICINAFGRWMPLLLLACLSSEQAVAQRNVVVVRPKEINDVLVNPGMGITTFQRFNEQEPNPPLKWSEIGPEKKLPQAATKPDFPDTSVSYCRWYWNVLEPTRGKYNWEIVDLAIEEARAHGQKLAIRLMPYSNQDSLPEWYKNSGARRANKDSDKDGKIWQPDFSDPLFLKYWGELVAEAGKRYDGNPFLDTVDVSSVGYWGEGWSPYMPDFVYQKPLIDIWLEAFKRTPLLMNFDEPMERNKVRAGDWTAGETCGRVQPILTFQRRCWRFTRNKSCEREFKTFGKGARFRWKRATRCPAGKSGGTTWTTFWRKDFAGT